MKRLLMISFSIIFSFSQASAQQPRPWQERHAEGWAWYHDYEKYKEPILDEAPKDPIAILAIAKEDLERALATAMLKPTNENVLAYMILQKKWTEQATVFSQLWQRNVLEHPELASLTPTTQYGVQVKKTVEARARKALIQELAKENVLLFFYEGGNPYSKAFADVVKEFSLKNNWSVKAVSVDGIILRDFPNSIKDPSIAQEMFIDYFPSVFAVDINTRNAVPLAFGMVTVSQIEENIMIQFEGEND